MKNTIAIQAEKINAKQLMWIIVLGGVASFLPFVLQNQFITGTVVNAVFVLSLFMFGFRSTIFIALAPSLMALSGGLLPVVLAPIVPFIMVSNIIFIFSISIFQKYDLSLGKQYWQGVIIGAFLKFLFLFFSVNFIFGILIKQDLVAKVSQMMSWMQFVTAVLGGVIAWSILAVYKEAR